MVDYNLPIWERDYILNRVDPAYLIQEYTEMGRWHFTEILSLQKNCLRNRSDSIWLRHLLRGCFSTCTVTRFHEQLGRNKDRRPKIPAKQPQTCSEESFWNRSLERHTAVCDVSWNYYERRIFKINFKGVLECFYRLS